MAGKFDAGQPDFNPTLERSEVVDFSRPVGEIRRLLLTRSFSTEAPNLMSIFAFSPWVITLIVSCIFAVGVLLTFFELNVSKLGTQETAVTLFLRKLFTNITHGFSVLVSQEQKEWSHFRKKSSLLLLLCWGFVVLILSSLYSGQIISAILRSQVHAPFKDLNSFASCLNSGQCKMVTYSLKLSFLNVIRAATSGPKSELRLAIQRIPPIVIAVEEIPPYVLRKKGEIL